MGKIVVREGETIESALQRFKRDVANSGILAECRKRECYLNPAEKRKLKQQKKRKKKQR